MSGGALRGVLIDAPVVPFAAKFPDASLDYTLDLVACGAIDPVADVISTVSLATAPSGAGELAVSALHVASGEITFTAAGGQAGRVHTLKFAVTMVNGRGFEFIGRMKITPILPTDQAQPIPSAGFGSPTQWP